MSKSSDTRRLVCEFVVAAAVCAGGYYFLVDGAHAKLAAVRADIAKVQQDETARSGIGSLTDGQVNDLLRTTAEKAARMRARSAPALNESTMFARLSELASANSVRIEQLNPVQTQGASAPSAGPPPGTPAAAAAASAAQDGTAPAKDIRVGYSLAVTGKYPDLTAFVSALTDRLGYTIVKSVRITQPDLHNADMLRAAIETEHLAMDLSAVRVSEITTPARQPMPITGDDAPAVQAAVPGRNE